MRVKDESSPSRRTASARVRALRNRPTISCKERSCRLQRSRINEGSGAVVVVGEGVRGVVFVGDVRGGKHNPP